MDLNSFGTAIAPVCGRRRLRRGAVAAITASVV
jgi:hypothetical protein